MDSSHKRGFALVLAIGIGFALPAMSSVGSPVGAVPSAHAAAKGDPKPVVACAARGALHFRVAPRQCLILKRGCPGTSACYIAAERMRWNWGQRVAKGRGKRGFNMAGLFRVKIRLTKPIMRCGRRVFSKISVRGEAPTGGSYRDHARLRTCPSQFP